MKPMMFRIREQSFLNVNYSDTQDDTQENVEEKIVELVCENNKISTKEMSPISTPHTSKSPV
jgi:hypothetical protein